jgi:putative membrane protein
VSEEGGKQEEGTGGQGTPEQEAWKGLHPLSLLINLLPQLVFTLRGIWPLLLVVFITESSSGLELFDLGLLVAIFALASIRTFTHFLTFRYRVRAGTLEIKMGLLFRYTRSVEARRIQNMEIVQNPIHKLFGLVELRIETAGDASTHGLLSAIDTRQAEELQVQLHRSTVEDEEDLEQPPFLSNSILELLTFGFTQKTVGTVVVLTAISSELFSLMNPRDAAEVANALDLKVLLGFFMVAFSGSYIWSAGKAILTHAGFQLRYVGDRLQTVEGLLTRRKVEIPQKKVQLIEIHEPILRRAMGFGSIYIETAAFGMADGELRRAEGVVPMAESSRFKEVVSLAAPQVKTDPWSVKLLPPHPRAFYRNAVRKMIRAAFMAGLIIFTLRSQSWSWWALGLIPLAIPVAWLDWSWQGWLITENAVITRRGFFTRQTWLLDREKVQSVHIEQGPVMKLHGLGKVLVRVAGTELPLPDIGIGQARECLQELRRSLGPTEEQLDSQDAGDDPGDVRSETGPEGMPVSVDTDASEIHSEDIEGRLG